MRLIKKYQQSTDLLIPKLRFNRLVRELIQDQMCDLRVEPSAFLALQESCEHYLVELFGASNLAAKNANRLTLYPTDLKLVRAIRGEDE